MTRLFGNIGTFWSVFRDERFGVCALSSFCFLITYMNRCNQEENR